MRGLTEEVGMHTGLETSPVRTDVSRDGKRYAAEAHRKTSKQDSYKRTLESYYRTSQQEDYGGRLWQHLLSAVGSLPTRLICIVNEVCAERTERNQAFAASSAAIP